MRILILLGTLWIAQVTVSSIGMTTGYGERALFSSDVIDYLFIWDVLALKLPPGFVGTQLILNGSSKPGWLKYTTGCIFTGSTVIFREFPDRG